MAANGHGTSRIVLVPRSREARPPELTLPRAADPLVPRSREARPPELTLPRAADPRQTPAAAARTGWTLQRLMIGASLGGTAVLVGGILFKQNFTLLTGSRGPILAIAFGLFVIGLIVFFGCLIGLAAAGIRTLADRHGWLPTSLGLLAPGAFVYALWGAGAYGFMYPALLTLLLAGGFVIAVSR